MKPQRKASPAVMLGCMACIGLFFLYGTARQYQQVGALVAHGSQAQASIDSVLDHSRSKGRYAKYSFSVEGQTFQGQDGYKGALDDKGPITVTYLPEDPTVSLIDPDAKLSSTRLKVGFSIVWLLLGGFAWIGMRGAERQKRWLD